MYVYFGSTLVAYKSSYLFNWPWIKDVIQFLLLTRVCLLTLTLITSQRTKFNFSLANCRMCSHIITMIRNLWRKWMVIFVLLYVHSPLTCRRDYWDAIILNYNLPKKKRAFEVTRCLTLIYRDSFSWIKFGVKLSSYWVREERAFTFG